MKTPNPDLIEEIVRRVTSAVHPLRVILFGSAARGEMSPGHFLIDFSSGGNLIPIRARSVFCDMGESRVDQTKWIHHTWLAHKKGLGF